MDSLLETSYKAWLFVPAMVRFIDKKISVDAGILGPSVFIRLGSLLFEVELFHTVYFLQYLGVVAVFPLSSLFVHMC